MQLNNPFIESQGIELIRWEPDEAVFRMLIEQHHLNRYGYLHGGLIATLLDVACGYAGMDTSMKNSVDYGHSVTVMLNISYLNPIHGGAVIANGVCNRKGRRIYFSEATLSSESGELIATAQGCFKQAVKSA
tara:strand:- start:766 stop:1161 length:396 start_codon:yes stop_codon:yes gene_type:complete